MLGFCPCQPLDRDSDVPNIAFKPLLREIADALERLAPPSGRRTRRRHGRLRVAAGLGLVMPHLAGLRAAVCTATFEKDAGRPARLGKLP